jgi:hypothetical protein
MSIFIAGKKVKDIYLAGKKANSIYLGGGKIFSSTPTPFGYTPVSFTLGYNLVDLEYTNHGPDAEVRFNFFKPETQEEIITNFTTSNIAKVEGWNYSYAQFYNANNIPIGFVMVIREEIIEINFMIDGEVAYFVVGYNYNNSLPNYNAPVVVSFTYPGLGTKTTSYKYGFFATYNPAILYITYNRSTGKLTYSTGNTMIITTTDGTILKDVDGDDHLQITFNAGTGGISTSRIMNIPITAIAAPAGTTRSFTLADIPVNATLFTATMASTKADRTSLGRIFIDDWGNSLVYVKVDPVVYLRVI